MNFVMFIINLDALEILTTLLNEKGLPLSVIMIARGTAVQSMLDLLGIQSSDRRLVMTIADPETTRALIKEAKRKLYIGVPGHGMIAAVPIKSIGGGKTMTYLNHGEPAKYTPEFNPDYELIVAIANEGKNNMVMNAARSAGAAGGTVLHGKGTGSPEMEKFFKVEIGREKEVILIVARSEQKAAIMKAVLKDAGPSSEAGAIVFSLPVSEVAGFGMFTESED